MLFSRAALKTIPQWYYNIMEATRSIVSNFPLLPCSHNIGMNQYFNQCYLTLLRAGLDDTMVKMAAYCLHKTSH